MDPIIDKLTTARVGLLLKAPFFGNMATRMQLIDASEWCPTAATNGRNFYYNKKFVEKLSVKKLEFLFGHEICHCVFDHFGRVGSRDRQLSNIAQDFAVNQILVGKGMPGMSKEDAQRIRDEIKEAMVQSAAAAGAGKVPAGIQRLIKDMTEPKISWRDLVRQEIQSIVRNDYSFTRPNRKSMHSGAILPGMKEATTIDIGISIDMSGSIGQEDATVFLSEVKGIVDQYEDFKINLWCFDTEIYNHKEFSQDNSEELFEYEPQGGGGTDFEVNWTFMEENGIRPKKFIMFTDGYPCGGWGDEDYCDTIFIVKGNENAEAPFGQTVIYEKETA